MTKHILFLIEAFFLLLFTAKNVNSHPIATVEPRTEGLYNTNDHVVILNNTNFDSNVYNSNTSWLIEFYSQWCGHCQRFAPTWKVFGKNVKDLNSIVRIGVVDTSNPVNTDISINITAVPTFMFYPVNANPNDTPLELDPERDVASLQKILLDTLEIEKRKGRGKLWPNFIPYSESDLQTMWQTIEGSVNYIVLIHESPESIVGTSLILNFPKNSKLHFGRVVTNTESLIINFHQRNGSPISSITINNSTIDNIEELIKDKLNSLGLSIEMTIKTEDSKLEDLSNNKSITKIPQLSHQYGDFVFQLDLEKALRYSIDQEIPKSFTIDGDKMVALKNYLNILLDYFPTQTNGKIYLRNLVDLVKNQTSISGRRFHNVSLELQNSLSPIYSEEDKWIGCQGSTDIHRGYPCGLWTMFHLLTVNYANKNINEQGHDPALALRAIYGYVKYFFSCEECSENFLEMAEKDKIFEVKDVNESILWLWRAHNDVNRRLAGDITEDPEHKKIQYPSINECPECRDVHNNWIDEDVVLYLKNKYSSSKVNFVIFPNLICNGKHCLYQTSS
ncbi:sulfhydryl oxidase 2-like [Leptopilina boulardi]|uniref:sulfhydryl oxidase 2-like n=1 Tax=Leptopilina boulardi TaxID=63433 RepID=UPI0021F514DE|nr:sulfhydryl oxidase 2-like [Leptopilina boulardi]